MAFSLPSIWEAILNPEFKQHLVQTKPMGENTLSYIKENNLWLVLALRKIRKKFTNHSARKATQQSEESKHCKLKYRQSQAVEG